ncbi:MAG: DegV family protein [Clostridia bacterium]|nr:DegV family protein [Clostridia bacterium]
MKKVQIVADSTCDLSKELIEKYNIAIIPLCIIMDDKSYFDGVEVTPPEIFEWANKNKTTPKTSAASITKAKEIMQPFIDNGDDIIFFGISTKMSGTCGVIKILREQEEYDRIFIIDSYNLSTGIGLQVLRAADLAEQGVSAEDIVADIEGRKDNVRASFVIDTLTYLARGGRCTALTALMANTLRLHPMIVVRDGTMGVTKKYTGKIDVALGKYVEDLKKDLATADKRRVFITHSGCKDATVQAIYDKIAALEYFEEINITTAGGVISSHCGPNTLGVLFYTLPEEPAEVPAETEEAVAEATV